MIPTHKTAQARSSNRALQGHSHANYRHGHHGVNMFWSSVRGPYITVPAAVDHPSEPSGRTPLQ